MNTINNKNNKINSETTKLIDLFNKSYIRNPVNKLSDDNNKIDAYAKLVPIDLLDDIKYVVEKSYNGNYVEYFESVKLYFTTFTYEDLTTTNTLHGDLYNSPDCDTATRRYLKRERKPKIFHAASLLKLVGKGAHYYCPKGLFSEFKYNKKCEQEFIKNSSIVSTSGKILPLVDAVKNVYQKEAELINLIKTIEMIASNNGWTWAFITLTLGRDKDGKSYHPNPINQEEDFEYNGVSVKDSARLLNRKIVEVKKMLAKRDVNPGVDYIGAVSSESHKGAVCHKHMIIFFNKKNLEKVKECFFTKFPNLKMNEAKSFSLEDTSKPLKKKDEEYVKGKFRSTATHYIFKYIMKSSSAFDETLDYDNIKHHYYKNGEEHLLTPEQQKDNHTYACVINAAFRSYNGIRAFSFFGIENCLTKFRFLARNLERFDISAKFRELVKENNLLGLITGKYFDTIENIYIKNSKGGHSFVGCKVLTVPNIDGSVFVIKNFYNMVKSAVAKASNTMCTEIAKMNEVEKLEQLGLCCFYDSGVLVQNHTRKSKTKDFLTEFSKKTQKFENWFFDLWIKEHPINEELEFFDIVDTSDCPF